jgi:hypothetical protein
MTTLAPSTDLDFYSEEVILNPYDTYRRLRDTAPAVWLERYQVWAVTRYDDVYAALHDHRTFASGYGVALNDPLNEKMKGSALVSDPPYHDHVRGVMGGPSPPGHSANTTTTSRSAPTPSSTTSWNSAVSTGSATSPRSSRCPSSPTSSAGPLKDANTSSTGPPPDSKPSAP